MRPGVSEFSRTVIVPVVCGLLAAAFVLPAAAQLKLRDATLGYPEDWSHRHMIYPNPDTFEEAAAKGKIEEWVKNDYDPRFVRQLEKKEKAAQEAKQKGSSVSLKKAKPKPNPSTPTGATIPRDWSNVMGGVSGSGSARLFPAKFNFGTSSKSCTSDFIVFTTSSAGADSTGNRASRTTGDFTGTSSLGTFIITKGTNVLTLTAGSGSPNLGITFDGNVSTAQRAINLANAINRNGGTVGVTASVTGGGNGVVVTAITAGTATISLSGTLSSIGAFAGNLAGGTNNAGQPTIFALNNLYKDVVANQGCQTETQAVPATYWSYNTGTGAVADLSPVISYYDNGAQVAFVQRSSTNIASLVLLKWRAGDGTVGVPVGVGTLASVTPANYRSCAAPCMTVMTFNGSPNNTNSAPYVDYAGDILYVGDNAGNLHKFTGVFNGTPSEQTTGGFPAPVSTGSILSSPVFDSGSGLVFVGSGLGGKLHSVDSLGAVLSSGQIARATANNGVRDAPTVDSNAQRVYVVVGNDNSGTGCNAADCMAVYQFPTNSSISASMGTKRTIGTAGNQNNTNRVVNSGAFDDAYYSSGTQTGGFYVCGSTATAQRTWTLWKVPIVSNVMGTASIGPTLVSADGNECSPITEFANGTVDSIYMNVTGAGSATGCTGGCVYAFRVPTAASFDTTSTSGALNATSYISVSASQLPDATELNRETTLSAAQAGTYYGMTITQGANNDASTTRTYTLRKNGSGGGGNTTITCTVPASQATCIDTTNTATFAAGDEIAVRVERAGAQNLTTTVRVRLGWTTGLGAAAGIGATGGAGGIIIDNTLDGGGSQVYFSTRTSPGIAVQATQAGLN